MRSKLCFDCIHVEVCKHCPYVCNATAQAAQTKVGTNIPEEEKKTIYEMSDLLSIAVECKYWNSKPDNYERNLKIREDEEAEGAAKLVLKKKKK